MRSGVHVGLWDNKANSRDSKLRVLILPGGRYGVERPGLAWPARALALHGWQVWAAAWNMPIGQPAEALVDRAVDDFTAQSGDLPRLVLAKSAGTLAAGWVADHSIPAIWTTPLLIDEQCVADIARASSAALLVAGSRDHTWDDDGARRAAKTVHRIPDADHGWQTGDWRTELAAIGELTSVVEDFASNIVA